MKHPFLLNSGGGSKARLLAAFVLLTCLLSLTAGSFAQSQGPKLIGNPNFVRTGRAASEQPAFYTNRWAVQVVLGTDPNALAAQLGMENLGQIGNLAGYYLFRAPVAAARNDDLTAVLRSTSGIIYAEQQIARQMSKRNPTDPFVDDQWHLNNTGQGGGVSGQDANVFPAWTGGYSGSGVTIAVVDDGLQIAHPDISPNYFPGGSYDFNDDEPNPTGTALDGHGTAAGGVAGAADDGAKCGAGVAYNAQLAGLRLIGGPADDAMEADALGYENQQNDIYTNSWGPSDSGTVLEAPGPLLEATFADSVVSGRGGLGSIFVWAGGNGYGNGDHSNADGYANSRFVIAVAASDDSGIQSWYSEAGANIMVNAPSNGGASGITTTDLLGGDGYNGTADPDCTNDFGGTSSATPLVAGVIGLMLEANPNLTWRDVQHILINSAEKNDPTNANPDGWEWTTNGAGYDISYIYGFGRVDAAAAVGLADTWTNVPAATTPFDSGTIPVNQPIPDSPSNGTPGTLVTSTVNVPANFIVEHVEVYIDATHTYRGDIVAAVQSPAGTVSQLLFLRDDSGEDYDDWRMTSVRHWGEASGGTWTFLVGDAFPQEVGTINSWRIVLHGYTDDGSEPTATPTPDGGTPQPTNTPGATPTDNPGNETELVSNGSFEAGAAPWVIKSATGDGVKCNKPGKPPVANTGNCAFRFKGNEGEASAVQQTLDFSGVPMLQGDTIDVLFALNVKTSSIGKIKLTIKYTDTLDKSKISGAPILTNGYEFLGSDLQLLSSNVSKIKFTASNRTTSGKWYIDDVSVWHIPAGSGLVALPGTDSKKEFVPRTGR
jgi:subtilisin-like proprotein convertase family protein